MSTIVIVDAFWGDAGKGKACAYLSRKHNADLCVRAGIGSNAGHSVYLSKEEVIVARQLPLGWLNPRTEVRVGSGVAVDPQILLTEIEEWKLHRRAKVDYRCPIITAEHREAESCDYVLTSVVGSTRSGCGRARADFVMRRARQARDLPELEKYTTDVAREANMVAREGLVIIEGSQGTFLSLALSPDYPFTTSDNCTTAAFLDDVGLNWRELTHVIMLVRTMPIRVGKGPLPYEMSPEEVRAKGLQEYGAVTGRPRRKASQIDWEKLEYAAMLNGPTEIGLTFCDNWDPDITNETCAHRITSRIKTLMARVEKTTHAPVTILDTGKPFTSIIDLNPGRTG